MKHQEARQQLPNSDGGGSTAQRSREIKKGGPQVSKTDRNRSATKTSAAVKESSSLEAADNLATTTWSKVVGRRAKRKEAPRAQEVGGQKEPPPKQDKRKKRQPDGNRRTGNLSVRMPRRAAVALSVAPGSARKDADLIAEARRKIDIRELGITDVKIRFSVADNVLVEIPGEDRTAKADNLMGKLKQIFPENEVKVSRPIKRTEVRITGLDVSVQKAEVIEAVRNTGGCLEDEIKIGEIRQRTPRGAGSVWLQCPTEAAKKLVDLGRLTVG